MTPDRQKYLAAKHKAEDLARRLRALEDTCQIQRERMARLALFSAGLAASGSEAVAGIAREIDALLGPHAAARPKAGVRP